MHPGHSGEWATRAHRRGAGAYCGVVHSVACFLLAPDFANIVWVGRLGGLGHHAWEVTAFLGVHEEVAPLAHERVHAPQWRICQPQLDLSTILALHVTRACAGRQTWTAN